MKFGVKTYDDGNFLKKFENKSDFFEIMALEGVDYSFLNQFKLPLVLHIPHYVFGINFANKTINEKNNNAIDFGINLANRHKINKIVLHPGLISDENCSEEQAISSIEKIKDKRAIIENMPLIGSYLCTTPKQTKIFLEKTKKDFCLDINHAITSAVILNQDPQEFIKEFLKLNPKHYHLGGQNIKNKKDHICFKESDINLKEILELIPNHADITLEVTTNIKKTEEDLEIIKNYSKII